MSSPSSGRTVRPTTSDIVPAPRTPRIKPGLAVDQGDHRQVVTELMAEPEHRIERPVDVLGIEPGGEDPEEGVEQVARGFQVSRPLGDPLFQVGVGASQLLGHPGERQSQGADLVAGRDVDPGLRLPRAIESAVAASLRIGRVYCRAIR